MTLMSSADPNVLHSLWIYWKNMKNHNEISDIKYALNRDGEAATFSECFTDDLSMMHENKNHCKLCS